MHPLLIDTLPMALGVAGKDIMKMGKSAKHLSPAPQPIFTIGGTVDILGYSMTLRKVAGKDLLFHGEFWPILKPGDLVKIEGHEFRMRKIVDEFMVFRPVVGLPHNYIQPYEGKKK